ncbi:MAG: amino acid adenylation domain-containing protein [Acidobacteriota bacterium]
MNGEHVTQTSGFSTEELELLTLLLEEEGVEVQTEPAVSPRREKERVPLSLTQQRLWFLYQLDPSSSVYNLFVAARLKGRLEISALQEALNEVVRRHEVLRTTFSMIDRQPMQIIAPALSLKLAIVDLSDLPDAERQTRAQRLSTQESQQPFDLERGPLLRTSLLRLAREEHQLLMTMHHIISDAWSLDVLVREVVALYEAYSNGKPSPLPALPIQYADYAVWQRERLQGERLEQKLSYWREQLADITVLELPNDHPRPPVQSFRGGINSLSLSEDLSNALVELGRREGATLFMTLLATINILLYRYTCQEDIAVGTPLAGRNRLETEKLIGYFINMLVLRTNLAGAPSFLEVLRRVREVTLGAHTHQELPFEKILDELQPQRDLSIQPLFQVVLVLQNAARQSPQLPGLNVQLQEIEDTTAKFDLTFMVNETSQGVLISLQYNSDLFDPETANRMLSHLQTLLRSIVENPSQTISRLPLLTEEERHELLTKSNKAPDDFGLAECLHQLFESQAERAPDAVAVTFQGEALTYGQLDGRANQLAHYLQAHGVGPEVMVPICMERSLEMVVGILGILKAGGAYVPLDPAYPKERLAFMLDDTQSPVLLTQQSLLELLPAYAGRIACIDADGPQIAEHSKSSPVCRVATENAAYVIYTSGSTGKAKGVVVEHAQVVRLLAATQAWYNFNSEDVWTFFHSYAFDFSVWELWGAFLYGGRLIIVPYDVSRAPEAFYELLRSEQVTVLNQTPTAFRQLLSADDSLAAASDLQLRLVIFGGEALEFRSLDSWFARHGDTRPQLVNMYGITETTVHTTYRPVSAKDIREASGSMIGKPIPDLAIYVLDSQMELVPLGVAGEMYVGGAGLARGYLNRPELTAQRFIAHPWSSKAGARLYRSGDLARRVTNGDIQYLGRIDDQVKIRGHRIEIAEIETALSGHPAVRQAVVIARQDTDGEKRLVAYVTLKQEATVRELRQYLKEKLPQYMMPSAFVVLERLPLTTNGKVDRRALPAPHYEGSAKDTAQDMPHTEVEELLAVVWAEILGVERLGIHDNFFALGGDSIRSVQLVALAREKGLSFSIQQLFKCQTIAELAKEIQFGELIPFEEIRSEPFSLVSAEDRQKLPDDLEDAYPLTMLQAGMFYHMELTPDSPVYHNVDDWQLRAHFDEGVLREALHYAVARHAVLRTSFDLTSYSEPLQLVHKTAITPITVEDLRHLSPAEQEKTLDIFTENEKRNRFDLSLAPQVRFHIHRRTDDTFELTLIENHAIFDGWSLTSTLAEIFTRYFALLKGERPADEPPPAVAFRDFVRLERMALEAAECQDYWDRVLRDCAPLRLPRRPASSTALGGPRVQTKSIFVSRQLSDGLKQAARAAGVPIKSVLLAAHLKTLSLISGQTDILAGLASNGRPEVTGGTEVRGLFLNTVPLRLKLLEGTWLELIQATFATELELLPFRRFPLSAMQKRWGNQTLCETQFNFVHFHALDGILRSGNVEVLKGGLRRSEETHFALCAMFGLAFISGQVVLDLEYDSRRLSEEQIKTIAGHYAGVLHAIAAEPQAQHHQADLLSAEIQELQAAWAASAQEETPNQDGAPAAPTDTSYAAPQTEIERRVAEIWQQVLQVEELGVNDNFFDLGGDSLLMLRVHSKLKETFMTEISMVDTFQHPTIATIARHLSQTPAEPVPVEARKERVETHRKTVERQRQRRKQQRANNQPKEERLE